METPESHFTDLEVDEGLFAFLQEMELVREVCEEEFNEIRTFDQSELTTELVSVTGKMLDAFGDRDAANVREHAAAIGIIASIFAEKYGELLG